MTPPRSTAARVALPPTGAGPAWERPCAGPMHAFLLIISCLGQRYELPTLAPHSFDAWLTPADAYPQACSLVVRPLRGGAA